MVLAPRIAAQFQHSPRTYKLVTEIGDYSTIVCLSVLSLRWILLELRIRSEYVWPQAALPLLVKRNFRLLLKVFPASIGLAGVIALSYVALNYLNFQMTEWYDFAFGLNVKYILVKLYFIAELILVAGIYFLLVPYLYVKGLRAFGSSRF
jgi:hypothetical protein